MSLSSAIQRLDQLTAELQPAAQAPPQTTAPQTSFATTLQTATAQTAPAATSGAGQYASTIDQAASRYGVDPSLVSAVVQQESGFDTNATSSAGAAGLMQLMPATAQSLGVTNPYDPTQSIDAGTRYLKGLLDEFGGDTSLALAAYNAGPNAVRAYGGVPPYPETQAYVTNITNNLGGTA